MAIGKLNMKSRSGNIGKMLKATGKVLAGASGDYFKEVMPTTSSIASSIKPGINTATSSIKGAGGDVISRTKQLMNDYSLKNIIGYLKSSFNEYVDDESDDLQFDTDTEANAVHDSLLEEDRFESASNNNANKIGRAVTDSAIQSIQSNITLTANIQHSLDVQTKEIKDGFKSVKDILEDISKVLTKNTATIIEATIATSREPSGQENMIANNKFNFNDWVKQIKANSQNNMAGAMASMAASMMNLGGGPAEIFDVRNLAKLGLEFVIDKKAPNFKENVKVLDRTINDMIMGSLIRLGQNQSWGLGGQIARIFGIKSDREEFKNNTRSSIKLKSVPFDGIAHEAITNTIPGYLRKILVAVGGEDVIYDYRSRSFKSKSSIHRELKNISAANGQIYNTTEDLQKVFGTDKFGNMLYDMMITNMSENGRSNDILKSFETNSKYNGKNNMSNYLEQLLSMNDQISLTQKEIDRINQISQNYRDLITKTGDASSGAINMQVARFNAQRNRYMKSHLNELDKYNIDISEFGVDADDDLKTILERSGRLTDKEKKEARSRLGSRSKGFLSSSDKLSGTDYTNRALYEIWRRLNEGINVFAVGLNQSRNKPFKKFNGEYLRPPISYKPKAVSGSDFVDSQIKGNNHQLLSSMIADTGPNLLENQIDENGNAENLTSGQRTLRWLGSRGRNFGRAMMSGSGEQVVTATAGIIKDVTSVGAKALNKSFGNITGFLKHKFTGAPYAYQDTDKDGNPITVKVAKNDKGGILGFIGDQFTQSFDKIKDSGGKWFKQVSTWFNFDDGKSIDPKNKDKVKSKRNKFISASVGALTGGGLLGGPIGMIMGGLAGSMIGSLDLGDKIKGILFGRDDSGKPTGLLTKLGDKVIDPIKYQFQKTFHSFGNILKKNILGPLSDLGQAIKDRITASAESHFGKVFKFIGKAITAPFRGIGKLLMNIVKLPVNIIGGVTRGAANISTGLFGAVTGGLAKRIAGKSLATHDVIKRDRNGNAIQKVDENGNPVVDENGNPVYETETLSAKQFIKYRRKDRNREIREDNKKNKIGSFKEWQESERARKAERRKLFKNYTSEEVSQVTADNTSKLAQAAEKQAEETAEIKSSLQEQTEIAKQQNESIKSTESSVSDMNHHATTSTGESSIQTHDQGIHELLRDIIDILSNFGDNKKNKKIKNHASTVGRVHNPIKGENLPNMVQAAKEVISSENSTITNSAEHINTKNTNIDDNAEADAKANESANTMLQASTTVAAMSGSINDSEVSELSGISEEVTSGKPNKSRIKGIFNKLIRRKETETNDKGEKKQSWISKIIGGIGGVFTNVIGGVKDFFNGGFGSIIAKIAGIGILVGGANWLKNKGDGSILEGISTVAEEIGGWWQDHKEDIFDGIGKVTKFIGDAWNNLVAPLWNKVIMPLVPTLLTLGEALVPVLENLGGGIIKIIRHITGGATGEETPSSAGANAVLSHVDVNVDDIGAVYGWGEASHNEVDGSGDQITNTAAQNYINDQQRVNVQRAMLANSKADYQQYKGDSYIAKANNLRDSNPAKAGKYLDKAMEARAKEEQLRATGPSSYSGAVARSGAKALLSLGISNGTASLVSYVAQGLGANEEGAEVAGNVAGMAVSAKFTKDAIKSTFTGKKTFIDKVVDMFEKFINKLAEKVKGKDAFKGLTFTKAMFSKVDDFFAKILKKIPGMSKLLEKQGPTWLNKLATKLGFAGVAGASAAVTAGITVAVGALNGLINGLCGVEHLFGVLPDKATPLMVTISAGLKTIFGALEMIPVVGMVISIIDMLDVIITALFGKGLMQMLAEFLLGLCGEGEELQQLQEEFQSELAYYNETYGTDLNTATFNDKVNRGNWLDMLLKGKQDYDEDGHLRFDEAGGDIHHGLEQLFVGGERDYYKDEDGNLRRDNEGNAIQLRDAKGNVIKKDMKWGDYVGNFFGDIGRFFTGGDTYETDENGYAKLDENGNMIVANHQNSFFENKLAFEKQFAEGWNNFWQNVGGNISQFFHAIPKAFSSIGNSMSTMSSMVSNGDVGALWAASSDTEENNPLHGLINVFDTIGKVVFTVPTAIKGVANKISYFFTKIADTVMNDNGENVAEIASKVREGDVGALWATESKFDDDNPLAGIYGAFNNGMKVVFTIPTAITGVGKSIAKFFDDHIKRPLSKIWTVLSTDMGNIFGMIGKGDTNALWSSNSTVSNDTPGGGIFKALHVAAKVIATIPTAVVGVGKKIGNFFSDLFAPVPEAFNGVVENMTELSKNINAGDIEGLWSVENNTDENNPLAGIIGVFNTVGKVLFTIPTALSWVGHKIGDFFGDIGTSISNGFIAIADSYTEISQVAVTGDIGAMWDMEYENDDENNPLAGIMGGIVVIQKVLNTPLAAICWVGKTVGNFFGSIGDKISSDNKKYEEAVNTVGKAESVSKVWGVKFTGESLLSPFFNIGLVFAKLASSAKAVWNGFKKWIGDVWDHIFGGEEDVKQAAENNKSNTTESGKGGGEDTGDVRGFNDIEAEAKKSASTNKTTSDTSTASTSSSASSATSSAIKTVTEGGNPINKRPYITSHFGPRSDPYTGMHYGVDIVAADGDSSNVDVGSRFNGTVSKVISNVPDWAKAEQDDNGVWHYNYDGKYNDGGNQVWIRTDNGYTIKNMHLKDGSIPTSIKAGARVSIGDKIGKMGTTGWSTGNHLHYQIEDNNGNAIDPESNVMNGSTLSSFSGNDSSTYESGADKNTSGGWLSQLMSKISEAGSKVLYYLTGGLLGNNETEDESTINDGSTNNISFNGNLGDEAANIWNHLKSLGWTDEMISAVLGCWTCESGVKAKTIEYDYCDSTEYPAPAEDGKFPYKAVINSNALMDQWCQYLFDMYDRKDVSIDRSGYRANDGHYYPGIGYAGWTGDNTRQMLEYAKEKNAAWDDPDFQLDWMNHQLNDIYYFKEHLGTMDKLKAAKSPEEAAGIFATDFEGCPESWQDKRKAAARNIWEQWHGIDVVETGTGTSMLNSAEDAARDEWYSDYNKYVSEVVDKFAGGNASARSAYENDNPNGYTKWKAGRMFDKEKSATMGSGLAWTEYTKDKQYTIDKNKYVDGYVAKYGLLDKKAKNSGKGGDNGPVDGNKFALDMTKQVTNIFDAKGGPINGSKNHISSKITIPLDYTDETWRGGKKLRKNKPLGKGGSIDSEILNNAKTTLNTTRKMLNEAQSMPSIPTYKPSMGKGGAESTQTVQQSPFTTKDVVKMMNMMNAMLDELKSITGNTSSSSEYLEELNGKDFVDQGLRESINALGKSTKKTSSRKTNNGSARTITALARPQ